MQSKGCYRIFPIMRPSLRAKVQKRLSELGLSPADATKRGQLSRTLIYDVLDGKTKNVRTDTARRLARALDCDVAFLTGEQEIAKNGTNVTNRTLTTEVEHAGFVGEVSAGVWHELDLFGGEPDASKVVPTVPDPRFKGLKQFAVKVVGTSVNRVVPDGFYAICVPYWEARASITDRDLVVVERQRGGLYEYTIKRIHKTGAGWELRPDSTDPRYSAAIVLTAGLDQERDSPEVMIEIKGLVIWKGSPVE